MHNYNLLREVLFSSLAAGARLFLRLGSLLFSFLSLLLSTLGIAGLNLLTISGRFLGSFIFRRLLICVGIIRRLLLSCSMVGSCFFSRLLLSAGGAAGAAGRAVVVAHQEGGAREEQEAGEEGAPRPLGLPHAGEARHNGGGEDHHDDPLAEDDLQQEPEALRAPGGGAAVGGAGAGHLRLAIFLCAHTDCA